MISEALHPPCPGAARLSYCQAHNLAVWQYRLWTKCAYPGILCQRQPVGVCPYSKKKNIRLILLTEGCILGPVRGFYLFSEAEFSNDRCLFSPLYCTVRYSKNMTLPSKQMQRNSTTTWPDDPPFISVRFLVKMCWPSFFGTSWDSLSLFARVYSLCSWPGHNP